MSLEKHSSEALRMTSKSETDDISLKELIFKIRSWCKYLLSNWIVIFLFGLLGGGLGYLYAWKKGVEYTAVSTFVMDDGKGGGSLGQYSGLAAMMGFDVGGGAGGIFQGENIFELYRSRTMIEKTLLSKIDVGGKELLLIDRFIEMRKLRSQWETNPILKDVKFDVKNTNGTFSRVQDSLITEFVKVINNSVLNVDKLDKKLNIIQVEVKSKDELFSKLFNEQIVKNVSDFYVETKTKKSLKNLSILQHQTDSVRAVMNGAIFSAASVLDATPNLNPTRQSLRAPIQKSQYSAETNKLILGELIKNLELSKMSLQQETPLIQLVDKPIFPLEKLATGKVKGIVVGGLILSFLVVMVLTFKWVLKGILD